MKIYHSIHEFEPVENLVVTIGTFDGVHLGHQKLIRQMKSSADALKGETLILTFFPHPRMILYPNEHGVELLTTMREKIEVLRSLGVNHLVIHTFDKAFSEMSSDQFMEKIIAGRLNTKKLVIGHDHRFGKHREGGIENLLQKGPGFGFDVEQIPEEDVNNITVSSTQIRNALKEGKIETARAFLGRRYSLTGMVVHGKKLGRTIGFPTANLHIPEDYKLIPADGVYIVEVFHNTKQYHGLLSIGRRPTVEENGERSIEVYILDFNGEIYGDELTLYFMHRIREDLKFDSVEAMTVQINKDREYAINYLKRP